MALIAELQHLAGVDIQFVRRVGTDHGGVVPGDFGHRGAAFPLQPAVIGEAAIVYRGVGPEDYFELSGIRGSRRLQ